MIADTPLVQADGVLGMVGMGGMLPQPGQAKANQAAKKGGKGK